MFKYDALAGIFIGMLVGHVFTAHLAPYVGVIVILAVLSVAKLLRSK